MKIAIVGTGISGLGCGWRLVQQPNFKNKLPVRLTFFEKNLRLGGHTNTVDVTLDGVTHGVDTGFLVFNDRTYPHLIELFAALKVPVANSDMSFSVTSERENQRRLEWAGTNLNSVFAQRRNLFSLRFWRMLRDILKFNRAATAYVSEAEYESFITLEEFLTQGHYSLAFRDDYLLPMAGAIWSCPPQQMLQFPMRTFARFCHNHGLLKITDRPQWKTVAGGARQYVQRLHDYLTAHGARFHVGQAVTQVQRLENGEVQVLTEDGRQEIFDAVVLATHSDEALALLEAPRDAERDVLSAIAYQANTAVLHTDASVLPQQKRAWAAWNYVHKLDAPDDSAASTPSSVSVNYLINQLQPVPFLQPVIVSLNPVQSIDPAKVIQRIDYAHPVFNSAAIHAQSHWPQIQGLDRVWFCGAWVGYGFHEDGLKAGYAAADSVLNRVAAFYQAQHEAEVTSANQTSELPDR